LGFENDYGVKVDSSHLGGEAGINAVRQGVFERRIGRQRD
jgi:hypothetical protein